MGAVAVVEKYKVGGVNMPLVVANPRDGNKLCPIAEFYVGTVHPTRISCGRPTRPQAMHLSLSSFWSGRL